jgi:uncharacterized damage-inducible protein DinB
MYSLADTFLLNNRANLMLLDALTGEQLAYTGSPRARSIGDQFAHLHNVRLMWLEASGPETLKGLSKIAKGEATKPGLRAALEASAGAFAGVIGEAERAGRMRGYKRGPAAFCGYALAHEGHHRGEIILHLKYAKMPVDREVTYAIWEWEKI